MSLVGHPAPGFSQKVAVVAKDGECCMDTRVSLDDYKGEWLLLFFYPLDFTFICPTEIVDLADAFKGENVLGVSVDSEHTHKAWLSAPGEYGGLADFDITFPLVSDLDKSMAQSYGILKHGEMAHRAVFIIDPTGHVVHQTVNAQNVGRNIQELRRIYDALRATATHGGICPASWTSTDLPGAETFAHLATKIAHEKLK